MNFKNKKNYDKWLAYGHIHKDFENTPGNQKITIAGKVHKVKHKRNKKKSDPILKKLMKGRF